MLLTENISIILTNRNIKKILKKYNLSNLTIGDIVNIPINKIPSKSHVTVNVSCDYCGKELSIKYSSYTKSTKTVNKISCSSKLCSSSKIKDVCISKYGVENPFQLDEFKEKSKETNLLKYGVEYASMSSEFRNSVKETNLLKYGVENAYQLDKCKESILERYGVENPFQSEIVKIKIKETLIGKYGVDHPLKSSLIKDRIKETNLEKYGVENPFQSDFFKEKSKSTNLEKYGFDHPSKSQEVINKIKETSLIRYNFSNYTKTKDYLEKSKSTNLERYGVSHHTKSEKYISKTKIGSDINFVRSLGNSLYIMNCEKGHEYEINQLNYHGRLSLNLLPCTICHPIGDQKSLREKELFEFIKSIYKGEIIDSYRDVLEIDIYLPELKLGFEFNGIYWHSEKYRDKNYHIDKTNHFKERDIRIIHIWEDDWVYRNDIIKSQVSNLLKVNTNKVFARKCEVREIKECKEFLNINHIQGSTSSKIKIGLYYNNQLVSVMTFDKFEGRKKMEEGGYNLNRFCNKLNTSIIGGASKLLSYFIKTYNPTRIVSYADKDWSIGDLYYNLGFENIGESSPDYKYIIDDRRVHKSRYRKSRLNTNLTESMYMKEIGIERIYDCGKIKFEIKI